MASKKILISLAVIIFAGLSFLGGIFVGRDQVICPVCPPSDVDFSLFWEAWNKLQEEYVNRGELDTKAMIYGAISGMVSSLGDPYTVFFTPEENKRFFEDVQGTFEGVGMEIGERKGAIKIISPIENSPAQRAGLRAGDEIVKIDNKYTTDLNVDEAVDLIRGPKGTNVVLTIFREEWGETREITLTRDVIEIPSLSFEFIEQGTIANIEIHQFSEKARSEMRTIASQIRNSNAQKIILDLRNNPGGYLEVAQDMAGWFLDRGSVVVIEDFGGREEEIVYKAQGSGEFSDYKVVILINGGTASASEILAGALRDNRGIQLIGEKSFGKGSVQEVFGLNTGERGASLKVTVARWLTPNRNLIADVGLEPDVKVELTEEDFEAGRDPQLEKAVEILKGM